jgi:transcriptional regulator GlxA family with amidase domain
MDDLGAELGLSRVQLYRKVKVLTGQAPAELLRQTRVRKAHALILQTDLSLSEIAYDTGFSSPGYSSSLAS